MVLGDICIICRKFAALLLVDQMAKFNIMQRVLIWITPESAMYGTVIKISEDGNMVLVQTDDGNRYLKQSFEVINGYGRHVMPGGN